MEDILIYVIVVGCMAIQYILVLKYTLISIKLFTFRRLFWWMFSKDHFIKEEGPSNKALIK